MQFVFRYMPRNQKPSFWKDCDMATYKIDGAKFQSIEELKESLWPLYEGKMSREEFEKYVEENVQKIE